MKTNSNSIESNKDNSSSETETDLDQTTNDNEGEESEGTDDSKETVDDGRDEYGYEVEKDEDEKEDEGEAAEEEGEEKAVEKNVSGYGEDDAEEEAPVEKVEEKEKTPEELTEEQRVEKEFNDSLKDLSDNYDKDGIKKFAKDNKLTVDQVKAYVKLQREQDAAAVEENQKRIKEQRKSWQAELKADPEFGGANYALNAKKVETLIEKHMPATKKMLTEKGGMLPPYFMKDALRLAKAMDPKSKFVGGQPPATKKVEKSFLEDMYQ